MGMFKQMKDMKGMIHDAPSQIAQAQQLAANAQALAAAHQANAAQQMAQVSQPAAAAVDTSGPDFAPANGVSLDLYAQISKGVAAAGGDQSQAVLLAAAQGISPSDWEAASATWNARMTSNREVGRQFTTLYQAA
jgi:hypothetical protein